MGDGWHLYATIFYVINSSHSFQPRSLILQTLQNIYILNVVMHLTLLKHSRIVFFSQFYHVLKLTQKITQAIVISLWKVMVSNSSKINNTNKNLLIQTNWTEKTQWHMVLEILVLALEWHKNVAGLYRLMGFPLFSSLHPSSASSPCYVFAFSSLKKFESKLDRSNPW